MKNYVSFIYLGLALLVAPAFAAHDKPLNSKVSPTPTTVVELFTSQGCGGCIPASLYLKNLREKPGMLVLSWPVDYLDRFGWVDTLANPDHSTRQKNYNKRFGRGGLIYTPEMVIDGRLECIGHDKLEADKGIAKVRALQRLRVDPELAIKGDHLVIRLPASDLSGEVSVQVAWYASDEVIDIGGGENKGTRMHAINVVRKNDVVSTWTGNARTINIPLADLGDIAVNGVAVLLQEGVSNGAIVGAAEIALPKMAS